MTNYQPVPFPFDDPSNPDVAVETPLWKGGPRPQWEVSGEPDPSAVDKATNNFLLNGKGYQFAHDDAYQHAVQYLDDTPGSSPDPAKTYTYAQIGKSLWRASPPKSLGVDDVRHPISPSCLCPTPVTCATENRCLATPVITTHRIWSTPLLDDMARGNWLNGTWSAATKEDWLPVKSSPKQYVYARLSSISYCAGSWLCSISDWFDERT